MGVSCGTTWLRLAPSITPAFLGAQKWTEWLHNRYLLGGPQQSSITPAFSGAQKRAEWLHTLAFLGGPNKGTKSETAP